MGTASFRRGHLQELLARRRRGLPQLRTGAFNGPAAGRDALIDGFCGVAHFHVDGLEGHVQLFGDDLRKRGFDARTQIHFAREHSHFAIASNGDPGVQRAGLRLVVERTRRARRHLRHDLAEGIEKVEADHQGARPLEDLPA